MVQEVFHVSKHGVIAFASLPAGGLSGLAAGGSAPGAAGESLPGAPGGLAAGAAGESQPGPGFTAGAAGGPLPGVAEHLLASAICSRRRQGEVKEMTASACLLQGYLSTRI